MEKTEEKHSETEFALNSVAIELTKISDKILELQKTIVNILDWIRRERETRVE